jgi:hypothetical protein
MPALIDRGQATEPTPAERNRRTARLLVALIVFLVIVSIVVIWVRN